MKNIVQKTKKIYQTKKGFSFLEMIIIVAIITIMTLTMFVVSFKDRDKKKLEAVGREVAAAIRETQNNALTGKQRASDMLPCGFIFTSDGDTYQIKGSYRALQEVCADDNDPQSYTEKLLDENLSQKKIAIEMFTSATNGSTRVSTNFVAFGVPYGKYFDGQETSIGTDLVLILNDGRKFHICVHATGLIEELGFNDADVACVF